MSNVIDEKKKTHDIPSIVGAGLVVLDIIIDNGSKTPIFTAGGTCGNVLSGLSFLGWNSKTVSRAGTDIASKILIQDLYKDGVEIKYVTREEKIKTPRIIEKLNSNGVYAKHNFYLRCPACNNYLPGFRSPRIDFIDDVLINEETPEVFFFDRVTNSTIKMARKYRERGTLIFFEPNDLKKLDMLMDAIRFSHVLKFSNKSTTKRVEDLINDNKLLRKIGNVRPNLIIQTLGEAGLLYNWYEEDKWYHQKGNKLVEVYDTCGAGDWSTVGFLYYLQKLARKIPIKLSEAIRHSENIESALNYSQILAAISSMFVGARGLSKALSKEDILEITDSHLKKNRKSIPMVKHLFKTRNQIEYIVNRKELVRGRCTTCLLEV